MHPPQKKTIKQETKTLIYSPPAQNSKILFFPLRAFTENRRLHMPRLRLS